MSTQRYAPGAHLEGAQPGDFVLTHRNGPIPRLIRLAERARFRGPDRVYAHWSHAALVVSADGMIVEAEASGVQRSPISRYLASERHLVRLEGVGVEQRAAAARYAESQVGNAFGFLELAASGISLLTGQTLRLQRASHMMCSVLVARSLERAGQHFERPIEDILPADLAKQYRVRP